MLQISERSIYKEGRFFYIDNTTRCMENFVFTQKLRNYLAQRYPEQDLRAWFDPLSLSFDDNGQRLLVGFPHAFFATWFSNGPQTILSYAVRDFCGENVTIIYHNRPTYGAHSFWDKHKQGQNTEKQSPFSHASYAVSAPTAPVSHKERESHTLDPVDIEKGREQGNAPLCKAAPSPVYNTIPSSLSTQGQQTRFITEKTTNKESLVAHQKHTFDTFIVNHKNTFPLAAAKKAAFPSRTRQYNPVLIYGESGSGKSHMLHDIAHELQSAMGTASVYCKSVTDIEILYARGDKLVVRKHLMQREAFLLDDIQILSDLPHLHDEFICLFDYFLHAHKQMAFACTGGLTVLQNISPALYSRLELGLILHLKDPDVDVRARFVHAQCAQLGLKLSREQVLLLAQRCPSFRHIMGLLLKVSAFIDLGNEGKSIEYQSFTIEDRELERLLRHTESGRERKLSHKKIIDIVSDHFTLTSADILGEKRHKDIVFARQVAMFLCRDLLGCSFPTLGRFFGGKDHSTTMYSVNKINKLQHDNKDTHTLVTELKKRCLSREN